LPHNTVAVVLAAGLGTRMKSRKPKVLHEVAGKPLIEHVLSALQEGAVPNPQDIIIVTGYEGDKVQAALGEAYRYVRQEKMLGTGHALLQALPLLAEYQGGTCLVLCGDTPLLTGDTLQKLMEQHHSAKVKATVLTARVPDPTGYGRIVKGKRGIEKIVEEKDALPAEKQIREINTGAYCFDLTVLKQGLSRLTPANAQGEYYLTDLIKYLVEGQEPVETFLLEDYQEAMGINNRVQLAEAEAYLRQKILRKHMLQGVTVLDPLHTYVGLDVRIGMDTVLYPGVILEGETVIGEDCAIGPYTRIVDSRIADHCWISQSYLIQAKVGKNCTIGPYSYLRPGTELDEEVKVGDFAEVKNSVIGRGSKIPHLSYVGDSVVGSQVNIGAGTITCNYDGERKHRTIIGDGAFVGSNTNLVAPIKVGDGAYIGAGSTVTRDIPAGALAVARGEQRNIENWSEKKKQRKKAEEEKGN
jgi:bifunctional UDP-N-acetylglucosamine pyrophosphorylase/glucosamine-1-phosphate N-acetyltransferase